MEFNPKVLTCIAAKDTRAKCISKTGACLKCPVGQLYLDLIEISNASKRRAQVYDSLAHSFATMSEEEANDANEPYYPEDDEGQPTYDSSMKLWRKPCGEDCDACRAKCNWYAGVP